MKDQSDGHKPDRPGGPSPAPHLIHKVLRGSRLVVQETVYHQVLGEQPVSTTSNYQATYGTEEDHYKRRVVVGSEWQPIDVGWVTNPSLLLIHNDPPAQQTIQSADQGDAIEIGMCVPERDYTDSIPFCSIPTKQSVRITSPDIGKLLIRSLGSQLRITIIVYPGDVLNCSTPQEEGRAAD